MFERLLLINFHEKITPSKIVKKIMLLYSFMKQKICKFMKFSVEKKAIYYITKVLKGFKMH